MNIERAFEDLMKKNIDCNFIMFIYLICQNLNEFLYIFSKHSIKILSNMFGTFFIRKNLDKVYLTMKCCCNHQLVVRVPDFMTKILRQIISIVLMSKSE